MSHVIDRPLEQTCYAFEPVTAAETARWDILSAGFTSRSVFHRTPWLDYLAESRGLTIRRWAIRDHGQTVAYFCGGMLRMGPFRILGSPLRSWGTNVMGPLMNDDVDQRRLLRSLDDLARRERLSVVELENAMLSSDELRAAGFQRAVDWTYIVKLTPDKAAMWAALESACRNRIRNAERAGVRIEDVDDPAIVDEYYDFYLKLMERKRRRPPFSREIPRQMFAHLKKADGLFALRATDRAGRTLAVGLFPHDDETTYFWGGASDETMHSLSPNDLLHWHAMVMGGERGLRAYNTSGHGRFKRKFGGALVEMARWHKCYSPSARWARRAYAFWFDRWSRFDPRRLALRRRTAPGLNGAAPRATELPIPRLRQRATFRLSDIYQAPLHDFPIRDEILFQYLPISKDMNMLEIGPGSGFTAFRLSRQVRSITLADIAEGNVNQLRQALGHVGNLDFACVDVCRPGLRDVVGRSFDAVYAIEVFELLPDPRTCLLNLASVTRPGGLVLIQFPNYPPEQLPFPTHFKTKRELDRLLGDAGFARWTIAALRLRPHARFLYKYFHEKPIRAYRRRRSGRGPHGALVYDESWAFRHGHTLEPFKYMLHTAWAGLSATMHAGGPAFEHWDPGTRILNHNLLVLAQR